MTAPTATPWSFRQAGDSNAFCVEAPGLPWLVATCEGRTLDENRANAATIVRLVNSHALILQALEAAAYRIPVAPYPTLGPGWREDALLIQSALQAVWQAMSKDFHDVADSLVGA